MTDPYVEDEINLRDYWRVLVRRRFLILGITFVIAVAAAVFTLLQPNIYQSKITLLPLGKGASGLQSALGALGNLLPLSSLRQESPVQRIEAILESRTLAENVIQGMNLIPRLFEKSWDVEKQQWMTEEPPTMEDALKELKELVKVDSDKETGVITISVQHTDSDLAAEIANQYVEALQGILDDKAFSIAKKNRLFIESKLEQVRKTLKASEEALRNFEQKHGIVSLDPQTAASVFSLTQAPEVKLQYGRLQREVLVQNKLFALLVEQLEHAKIEESRDDTTFQVLDPAIPSEKRIKPQRRQTVTIATAFGFFLAAFLALLLEYFDTTVGSKEEVERQTGLLVLAVLPSSVTSRRQRHRRWQKAGTKPKPSQGFSASQLEALRYLHTRLKHFNGTRGPQSLLFTSPESDEGLSKTLLDLATVSAGTGEKVLLIDSNVRKPTLHQFLSSSVSPGLTELLADPEIGLKALQTTGIDNLHLISAGTVTQNSFTILEGSALDGLLARVKETYDLIFCVAPPVLNCNDAAALASKLDAVCLILTTGRTQLDTISEARTTLETVQARVIGAILRQA